jgi:hypothetical protein
LEMCWCTRTPGRVYTITSRWRASATRCSDASVTTSIVVADFRNRVAIAEEMEECKQHGHLMCLNQVSELLDKLVQLHPKDHPKDRVVKINNIIIITNFMSGKLVKP